MGSPLWRAPVLIEPSAIAFSFDNPQSHLQLSLPPHPGRLTPKPCEVLPSTTLHLSYSLVHPRWQCHALANAHLIAPSPSHAAYHLPCLVGSGETPASY
jgi:hypothetical protein